MSHEKVCLVTGATGVLGHGIQAALSDIDTDIKFIWLSSKDGNCSNYDEMKIIFQKNNPTHIIHLAARVGGLFANLFDNIGFFNENTAINTTILALCHEFQVQNGIFCLSTCIFPHSAPLPLTEDKIHDGPPHPSNEGYAMAKRNLEMLVRFYRKKFNYNWICIIPTNIYGPFDNFNLSDSHVIPGLIHKCYLSKKNNENFIIRGTGKPLRQFIFSIDAGKIILKLLLESPIKLSSASYIICDEINNEISISEVAQLIAQEFNYQSYLEFDSTSSDGIFQKSASNKRLMECISQDFHFTPLKSGIEQTVGWFINNYEKCRK